MTMNKPRKRTKYRASHTHGCGSKKKRRGAGNRGGRGNAGTGKKADSKKPSIWKNPNYFGKRGFKSIQQRLQKPIKSINIGDIDAKIEEFVKKGKAEFKNGIYHLELSKIGYNKLLSKGGTHKKFEIKADSASVQAIEKIKKAGGKIEVKQKKEKKSEDDFEEITGEGDEEFQEVQENQEESPE